MHCICALRALCSHPAGHPQSTVPTASHQHQNHHRLLKYFLEAFPPAYSRYTVVMLLLLYNYNQIFYVEPQLSFSEKQHLIVILAPMDTCGQFH